MDLVRPAHAGDSEHLLDAMPDAVVMVGLDGRMVRANRQAEALSGYSRAELLRMTIEELVPEALRAGHVAHRLAYQRQPAARSMGTHFDVRFRRKDGGEFPAEVALSPVVTEQGVVVVASVRDITGRKQAEEDLLRAQEGFRLLVEAVRDHAVFMLDPEGRVRTWSPGAARLQGYEAGEILGRHLSVFYSPADAAAGEPARVLDEAAEKGRCEDEGWRLRRDGSRFWASIVVTVIRDRTGRLLGFTTVARDVTERRQQDDRLQSVLEVAQATLEGRREDELLRLIAQRARALAQSALGVVVLPDPGGEMVTMVAADGRRADLVAGSRFPLAGSVTREVLASGRSVVLEERPAASGTRAFVLAASNVGPSVTTRLASDLRLIGGLGVTNEPGGPRFTDADRRRLELFAAQAAVALDHARARDDRERLAVLEDRERIGRELHSSAIQALFSVGVGLQGAAGMTSDEVLRGRLEASIGQVDDVIRDMRDYSFGPPPGSAPASDGDLGRALQELAAEVARQHGVPCAVDVDQATAARLAGRTADIVQVARAALSGVGRHAGAGTCRLALRQEAGQALLEIVVPGEGGGGWGLRDLRERVASMAGSLEIASALGKGTTVRLRIQA